MTGTMIAILIASHIAAFALGGYAMLKWLENAYR